jgi:hypothetical protein
MLPRLRAHAAARAAARAATRCCAKGSHSKPKCEQSQAAHMLTHEPMHSRHSARSWLDASRSPRSAHCRQRRGGTSHAMGGRIQWRTREAIRPDGAAGPPTHCWREGAAAASAEQGRGGNAAVPRRTAVLRSTTRHSQAYLPALAVLHAAERDGRCTPARARRSCAGNTWTASPTAPAAADHSSGTGGSIHP